MFLLATLVPLTLTIWLTVGLLDRSLSHASTAQVDVLSRSVEKTGRALYQRTREGLKAAVQAGTIKPVKQVPLSELEPGQHEHFMVQGDRLLYLVRRANAVDVYERGLGVSLDDLQAQHADARMLVDTASRTNLRRGYLYTLLSLCAGVWFTAFLVLMFSAHLVTKPIADLTRALRQLADGNFDIRLRPRSTDEVGAAMRAFNESAQELKLTQEKLVQLAKVESWQTLARKMAHEMKNSLTPIRLAMEEIQARGAENDPEFIEQASQIVAEEVTTLERRVRAFSDFASEPPVRLQPVDVTAILKERIAFLRSAHPEVSYDVQVERDVAACADADLIRGVLTNLLENAAHAAGQGGTVRGKVYERDGKIAIEVHDSGAGLSSLARSTLFEPTISFKKEGMGLGLSIAKRSTMLSGGEIALVEGELGGAGFRVLLPAAG
jgi:nitrogen fixation/metabolism regulation signal transduction histidine kinase